MTDSCERCGRDRAPGKHRHIVTLHDSSESTGTHDIVRLCGECFNRLQARIREVGR